MGFVVDASVTLAWLFEDEASGETEALLERLREERVLVPDIWAYEIANALTVARRRSRITEAQSHAFAELLRSLPIDSMPPPSVTVLMSVADRHGLSAYDAAYLELAERTGRPLATLDSRLRDAATAAGVKTP